MPPIWASGGAGAGGLVVDLAGDVALEAGQDVEFGQALFGAALDIGLGGWVAVHCGQGDAPQGIVGPAVPSPVEPVAVGAGGTGQAKHHRWTGGCLYASGSWPTDQTQGTKPVRRRVRPATQRTQPRPSQGEVPPPTQGRPCGTTRVRAAYHQTMSTALILYGPKAVGKSWIAQVMAEHLHVYRVDPDELIRRLRAAGKKPDPHDGWLAEVTAHVQDALAGHDLVSVEATGAWASDWQLAHDLTARGVRVLRVWVSAPKEVADRRLQTRTTPRVSATADEASWIYDAATARAASVRFDLKIDTSSGMGPAQIIEAVRPLVTEQQP